MYIINYNYTFDEIVNIKFTIFSAYRLQVYVECAVATVLLNIQSINTCRITSETPCILTERVLSVGTVSNLYSGVASFEHHGDIDSPYRFCRDLLPSLQAFSGTLPQIRPRPLIYTSFIMYYPLIVWDSAVNI